MRTLWRFMVRDFKDTLVMWVLLAVITVVGMLVIARPRGDVGAVMLGYAYLFFFLIHLSQIWNGVFGRAIPREYILSLPVSRTRSFWIMWARSLVGLAPLLVLLWAYREDASDALRMVRSDVLDLEPFGDLKYLAFLAGAVWMFMAIFANAQNHQIALLTSRGKRRYLPWLRYFAGLGLDVAVLLLWGRAFFWGMPAALSIPIGIGCLGYSVLKARIAYVRWMWGNDAKLLRSRRA